MLLKPFCALIADDGLNVEIYISVILCNIEIRADKKTCCRQYYLNFRLHSFSDLWLGHRDGSYSFSRFMIVMNLREKSGGSVCVTQ